MRAGAYGGSRLTLGVLLGHSSPSSPRHDLLIKSMKPTLFEPGILASPFLQDPISVFQAPGLQLDPDTQLTFSVCYWGCDSGPYACMCYKYWAVSLAPKMNNFKKNPVIVRVTQIWNTFLNTIEWWKWWLFSWSGCHTWVQISSTHLKIWVCGHTCYPSKREAEMERLPASLAKSVCSKFIKKPYVRN